MGRALTDRQKRFCEEYVIDWNASRAAREAGYSEKTSGEQGYQLLQKPLIQAHIEEITKDLQRLAGVSALRNILELKNIAYSNISDVHDSWITLKDWETLPKHIKASIYSIKHSTRTVKDEEGNPVSIETVEIKMHDKRQAIEALNKMLGYNEPEKVQQMGSVQVIQVPDNGRN